MLRVVAEVDQLGQHCLLPSPRFCGFILRNVFFSGWESAKFGVVWIWWIPPYKT